VNKGFLKLKASQRSNLLIILTKSLKARRLKFLREDFGVISLRSLNQGVC
jgi:hypothetical protein